MFKGSDTVKTAVEMLEKLTQGVLCHGIKSVSEFSEFPILAKYLGIGKIVEEGTATSAFPWLFLMLKNHLIY